MPRPPSAPKIATLARLASAGLPVPEFIALADASEPDEPTWARIDLLLKNGPVIVRAALPGEDTADAAAAGLGSSIAGCRDRPSIRAALQQIELDLRDPWLASYFKTARATAQVLVQRQISGPWLAVVAQSRLRFVELHRRDGDERDSEPLASGVSPTLAGPLALLPASLRAPICELCDRVTAALPATPHGLDLELVADHHEKVWVVQARPLTRPLHPGWPAFVAAARPDLSNTADDALPLQPAWPALVAAARTDLPDTADDALPLPGLWSLDAEHNPAPLSPAHAGAIRRLAASHPALVRMRVLAGWLYNPDRLERAPVTTTDHELHEALQSLRARHIPEARAVLASFDAALAVADAPALIALVDRACEQLREVLERYASLPARPPRPPPAPGSLLSLQDRGAFLDVLPATWDIASPTLQDLSLGTVSQEMSPETVSIGPPPGTASIDILPDTASPYLSFGAAPPDPPLGSAPPDPSLGSASSYPSLGAASSDLSLGAASSYLSLGSASLDLSLGAASSDLSLGAASPHLSLGSASLDPPARTASPDLATLLGELDDHLFALGFAPLRRVYLRAALLLEVPGDDIFLLTPDELQAALRGASFDLGARRREHAAQAALFPPLQLYEGLPVPRPGGGWLRGLAIGPPSEGPLHPRRDLAELLADPPPADAVLAIPALTAQAAVVLRDLGVRAVCCEHGGALSHAALMARELGLSALVGCRGCTTIAPGTVVRLDTRSGRLRVR